MRGRFGRRNWRHLLYTSACLAMVVLATSAHYKPH
jgi:hypothetical protein